MGVRFRFDTLADVADVLALDPDIVVIATGGLPNVDIVEGSELAVSGWSVLGGEVAPIGDVLIFDDHAGHPGLAAAEYLCGRGAAVEIVTPERFFAADIGGLNHAAYARAFDAAGVRVTINRRLLSLRRDGNRVAAILGSDYSDTTEERSVDHVVIEHGTLPSADLYFALKDLSINRGAVDYAALIAGSPQVSCQNPAGTFRLYRIGDAVSGRNIHAAIYDGLRLMMTH